MSDCLAQGLPAGLSHTMSLYPVDSAWGMKEEEKEAVWPGNWLLQSPPGHL